MKDKADSPDDPLVERLAQVDRRIRRDRLREQIRELGGIVGGAEGADVSDVELSFLERVVAWETGPRSSHRAWLTRRGLSFMPPAELEGTGRTKELWRLIRSLAQARVFLVHTNHLSDAELYDRLWHDVLPAECPDCVRTNRDACHWDFADAGAGETELWLKHYASPADRREWSRQFPDTPLPLRQRPPYNRDRTLPTPG
jgi:hypothetical protein